MSAPSKRAGENAEAAVLERASALEYVPDSDAEHYDAELTRDLEAGGIEIVGERPPRVGDGVEIKSACVVYADDSHGRFYHRKQQHEFLLAAGGWYLLAVCEPVPERPVIAMQFVASEVVDEYITTWYDGGDGRADYYQLRWPNVIDKSVVYGEAKR
jgi:hypothetical protein